MGESERGGLGGRGRLRRRRHLDDGYATANTVASSSALPYPTRAAASAGDFARVVLSWCGGGRPMRSTTSSCAVGAVGRRPKSPPSPRENRSWFQASVIPDSRSVYGLLSPRGPSSKSSALEQRILRCRPPAPQGGLRLVCHPLSRPSLTLPRPSNPDGYDALLGGEVRSGVASPTRRTYERSMAGGRGRRRRRSFFPHARYARQPAPPPRVEIKRESCFAAQPL